MAAYSAQQQDEELARLQELSNKWEPDATGPFVSDLLDSTAITAEYANADPVYQVKTASLPQSFSHYRTCRGDGHCGWRAVAFSYFEALVRTAEPYKFHEEVARLKSLRNIMNDAGLPEDIYVDFAEEAWVLLDRLSSMPVDAGLATVLETFNDPNTAMSIITYFKLLTSAWMQKYPDQYQGFMNESVQSYCKTRIEPAQCEIEELGLNALLAVLVSPAGIAAEVHYLDRSPGDTINVIQYGWSGAESRTPPAKIRLLYRPGHYDILYKAEDLMVTKSVPSASVTQAAQQNVFVALQHASTETLHHRTAYQPETIEIPGMSFYTGPQATWPQAFNQYDIAPSPISPPVSSPRPAVTPTYPNVPAIPVHDMYFPSPPASQASLPNVALPHHVQIDRGTPFRPSAWEYTAEFNNMPHQSLCQTSIFRNSHYNTAHFNNPDFEPEQWSPDKEYTTTDRSRKKSSHA
ncbi:uncharacterized protein PV09_01806 [Verruconis gallopava]|uniref:ubiquitinyl hydrolase 1 n=1 Tax=Verruconis gallopava TaxID=253628 RepID=A0A0D2AN03_9PEZI|nr:uncharacterized protein PV09_01806 [Verruconis gallopava]KIW07895.1 hypothetical protein PV09_01806 [Verruconis gallopava]